MRLKPRPSITHCFLVYYSCNIAKNIINMLEKLPQCKRINRKQSARWQHLSPLKASAFKLEFFVRCSETRQLILEIGNAIKWVIEPY